MTSRLLRIATRACLLSVAVACAKQDGEEAPPDVKAQRTVVANGASEARQVPVGTRPASQCGWIPVSEVEALIGPFAAPPRDSLGGCLYTLQVPPELAASRARIAALQKRIGSTLPNDERPYALVPHVDVGVKTGERAEKLAMGKLASWDARRPRGFEQVHAAAPDATRQRKRGAERLGCG